MAVGLAVGPVGDVVGNVVGGWRGGGVAVGVAVSVAVGLAGGVTRARSLYFVGYVVGEAVNKVERLHTTIAVGFVVRFAALAIEWEQSFCRQVRQRQRGFVQKAQSSLS